MTDCCETLPRLLAAKILTTTSPWSGAFSSSATPQAQPTRSARSIRGRTGRPANSFQQKMDGVKPIKAWKESENDVLKADQEQVELRAETGTDLQSRRLSTRRPLALDQTRLITYETMESMEGKPADGFQMATYQKLMNADEAISRAMIPLYRGVVKLQASNDFIDTFSNSRADRRLQRLPSLKPRAPRRGTSLASLGPSSRHSTCSYGEFEAFVARPEALIGVSAVDREGNRPCFNFNMGGCKRAVKDGGREKG